MFQNEAKSPNLFVGDNRHRPTEVMGGSPVHEKAKDERQCNDFSSFLFGTTNKYHRPDYHAVHGLSLPVAPPPHCFLCSNVTFDTELSEFLSRSHLRIMVHDGYVPTLFTYAYGTVSVLGHWRNA